MSPERIAVDLNPEALCGIDAFGGLTAPERCAVARRGHCHRYSAGEQIVSYQDISREVFFILSGRVQAINFSTTGHQVMLQDLAAGQMFGELSAIDGEPRSACVIAVGDTFILSMSAAEFMELLLRYPAVTRATLKRLTSMVRHLGAKVFERDALSANQRVRAELLRLGSSQREGNDMAVITPAPTHNDIATRIGASRETVTREMAQLKKIGLINRRGNDLLIRDVVTLSRIVSS